MISFFSCIWSECFHWCPVDQTNSQPDNYKPFKDWVWFEVDLCISPFSVTWLDSEHDCFSLLFKNGFVGIFPAAHTLNLMHASYSNKTAASKYQKPTATSLVYTYWPWTESLNFFCFHNIFVPYSLFAYFDMFLWHNKKSTEMSFLIWWLKYIFIKTRKVSVSWVMVMRKHMQGWPLDSNHDLTIACTEQVQ